MSSAPEYPWVDKFYRQPLGAPKPGKILVQKGLADVLEKIARQGRDGFYAGEVAEKICATIKAEGGMLAERICSRSFASGSSR